MKDPASKNCFQPRSGCYKCRVCGKRTRETGEGESEVQLCRSCFLKAGEDNEQSDHQTSTPPTTPAKEIPPCIYELKGDGNTLTMKIMCKECSQRDLKDRQCFSSLLRAFASNANVDRIVLSDHVETQYFGKSLLILKNITALSYEMRQLSLRTPHTPSGKTPKECEGCEFHPRTVFLALNERFLRDIGLFYSAFHDQTVRLFEADTESYPRIIGIGYSDWDYEAVSIAKDELKEKETKKDE